MVKGLINKLNHNTVFFILIIGLVIARVIIGFNLHYWMYSAAGFDDGWMVSASVLPDHFAAGDERSLIKNMAYPVFLYLNGLTGVPYSLSLTLLWVLVAAMGVLLIKRFTRSRMAWLAVFAFLLFFPSAFETDIGTKLYRNSIIVPFIFMLVFALLQFVMAIVIDNYRSKRAVFGWSAALGAILLVNVYVKENGLWMLLFVGAVLAITAVYVLYREAAKLPRSSFKKFLRKLNWKNLAVLACALLLPIIIFQVGTYAYKAINQHYFGVFAINTRTDGAYGKFIDNIYKVKADGRSDVVWAPWDAVKKVFAVSPTLRSLPELETNILNTPWVPKGVKNSGMVHDGMIGGDFMTWVLRDAYVRSIDGKWSDAKAEDFFAKANSEIAAAFHDGRLEKAGLIQITPTMGGYTVPQMLGLSNIMAAGLKNDLFFYGYKYEGFVGDCKVQKNCDLASVQLNMDVARNGGKAHINRVANGIIALYQVVNPVLVFLAIVGVFMEIALIIRRKSSPKNVFAVTAAAVLTLGGIAVIFAISWFVNFIYFDRDGYGSAILYYAIEATPLLVTAELLGLYLFFSRMPAVLVRVAKTKR